MRRLTIRAKSSGDLARVLRCIVEHDFGLGEVRAWQLSHLEPVVHGHDPKWSFIHNAKWTSGSSKENLAGALAAFKYHFEWLSIAALGKDGLLSSAVVSSLPSAMEFTDEFLKSNPFNEAENACIVVVFDATLLFVFGSKSIVDLLQGVVTELNLVRITLS
ncbi:MAG: hypothetical protein WD716_04370 [Fimbriimonadaceae bacterium]